jgi:hypothetical protein
VIETRALQAAGNTKIYLEFLFLCGRKTDDTKNRVPSRNPRASTLGLCENTARFNKDSKRQRSKELKRTVGLVQYIGQVAFTLK